MTERAQPTDLELAALISSKICHDVIGPVGAIYNGLEILDEDDDAQAKNYALDVIRNVTAQASARLQFARFAFGAAGSAGAQIDLATAEQISRGLIGLANVLLPGKGLKQVPFVSEKELLGIVEAAAEDEVIEHEERELIESIIEFGDTLAREIMVPRPDMVTLSATDSVSSALDSAIEHGYSRFPVTGDSLDAILGIAANLIGKHRRAEIRAYLALARTGVDEVAESYADRVEARVSALAAHRELAGALAVLTPGDREVLRGFRVGSAFGLRSRTPRESFRGVEEAGRCEICRLPRVRFTNRTGCGPR